MANSASPAAHAADVIFNLEESAVFTGEGKLQDLEPLPMWDEFAPVPIMRLKEALLDGQLDLEIPIRQLSLTVPLRMLVHRRLPGLIRQLLLRLQGLAPGCSDTLTECAVTREVLYTMADAMCMLIVLGDTCTEAAISAQGFHVRDPGRPMPHGLIQQAVVWHARTSDLLPAIPVLLCFAHLPA